TAAGRCRAVPGACRHVGNDVTFIVRGPCPLRIPSLYNPWVTPSRHIFRFSENYCANVRESGGEHLPQTQLPSHTTDLFCCRRPPYVCSKGRVGRFRIPRTLRLASCDPPRQELRSRSITLPDEDAPDPERH